MEGVLNVSKNSAALSQCENTCGTAHRPVLKMILCQQLCANEAILVDLDTWGLKPRIPRKLVRVSAFADFAKTESSRSKIQFERRFMNNVKEQAF